MNFKSPNIYISEKTAFVKTVITFLCLVFLFFSNTLFAANNQEVILLTENTKTAKEIIYRIKSEFIRNKRQENLITVDLKDIQKRALSRELDDKKLIIPIGTKAIDFCIKTKIKSHFMASFTTQSAFKALTERADSRGVISSFFVGGVSLDQPERRIASLSKLIYPKLKTTGVVLGPQSTSKSKSIRRELARIGSTLFLTNITANDNPVKKLRNVFLKSQLFIVFPDKANINRRLARWIIALSYKHQVPVISYSKKYTEAGALASLYSSPAQIAKQTAEMAISFLSNANKSKKLHAPKYFDLSINNSVKKALNLSFPSQNELLRQLYKVAK